MAKKKKIVPEKMHRELWIWISENIDKSVISEMPRGAALYDLKESWPGWAEISGHDVDNACFACYESSGDCSKCPISWGNDQSELDYDDDDYYDGVFCESMKDSPYHTLLHNKISLATAKKLALQIANMEWTTKK